MSRRDPQRTKYVTPGIKVTRGLKGRHLAPKPGRHIQNRPLPDEPGHHEDVGQPGFPFTVLHVEVEAEAVAFSRVGRLPWRRPGDEGGNVGGVELVLRRKAAGYVRQQTFTAPKVILEEAVL